MTIVRWLIYAILAGKTVRTVTGIVLWATVRAVEWGFLRRYIFARPRMVDVMVHMLLRCFRDYPGKKLGVSMALIYGPGYCEIERREICWETPLGLAVWGDDGPLFGLGIEFRNGFLCIRQMQGISGRAVPPEFRDWPIRSVKLMMRFARLAGFRGVRLYRAHTSLFYHSPELTLPEGANREEEIAALRQRMRRRYDGTARRLKFTQKKNYCEWLSPPRSARLS